MLSEGLFSVSYMRREDWEDIDFLVEDFLFEKAFVKLIHCWLCTPLCWLKKFLTLNDSREI